MRLRRVHDRVQPSHLVASEPQPNAKPRTFKRELNDSEPPGQVEASLGSPTHPPARASLPNGPFIPASESPAEVTLKAVLLGLVLPFVLAAPHLCVGLKVGLTVAPDPPAPAVPPASHPPAGVSRLRVRGPVPRDRLRPGYPG